MNENVHLTGPRIVSIHINVRNVAVFDLLLDLNERVVFGNCAGKRYLQN